MLKGQLGGVRVVRVQAVEERVVGSFSQQARDVRRLERRVVVEHVTARAGAAIGIRKRLLEQGFAGGGGVRERAALGCDE